MLRVGLGTSFRHVTKPARTVLATRICNGLVLELLWLAMVPESLPLVRLLPSRAGHRGHRPSGVHRE